MTPAPHTTATPQGPEAPARSSAKVSLPTTTSEAKPRAANSSRSASSSLGRSAPAR
ncbi:hypothetical protein [Nonomuraea recticatena]|uniref:hypothetical protein n=1 Tax=Nonomuraea recticatena TaxID=46178 RepID=UPI003620DAE5